MSKRKGTLVLSPHPPSVYSSPTLSRLHQSTSIFNSFSSNDSHDDIVSTLTWQDTTEIMDELLLHFDGPSDGAIQVERCNQIIEKIKQRQNDIEKSGKALKGTIQDHIDDEENALKSEELVLTNQRKSLTNLQDKIDSLVSDNSSLSIQNQDLERKIAEYEFEASQEIEQIDEVEAARMKEVPSLKHKISLYASITGIRWDFENEDKLKGEIVSILTFLKNSDFYMFHLVV